MNSRVAWSEARCSHSSRTSRSDPSRSKTLWSRTVMMMSTLLCILFACLGSTLVANPLQTVNDQTLQTDLGDLSLPSQSSNIPVAVNTTSSLLNTSESNEISIKCNGDKYGFKPDIEDCTSMLRHQQVGRTVIRFGNRTNTQLDTTTPLPYRLMGGTYP